MSPPIGFIAAYRDRLRHPSPESAPDPVQTSFEDLGIHEVLRGYAFGLPFLEGSLVTTTEDDLNEMTVFFADTVAGVALESGDAWVKPIEHAFNMIIDSMDRVADEKFGAPKPRSAVQALLVRAGVRQPERGKHFAGLPAEFWRGQFLHEYSQGLYAERSPEESDQQYLARSIHHVFQGFALSYFSPIQQADRLA